VLEGRITNYFARKQWFFKKHFVLHNAMEHVSIQLETAIAKQIERDMREFNYSTKTEFIRDSIRDKLKQLAEQREKKKAWQALVAARGIFKGQGKAKTDEEFYKLREEAGKEFMDILEKRFSQK
jgi:Arc/MetJ-type ribon-helix-helix transcriptional regulator